MADAYNPAAECLAHDGEVSVVDERLNDHGNHAGEVGGHTERASGGLAASTNAEAAAAATQRLHALLAVELKLRHSLTSSLSLLRVTPSPPPSNHSVFRSPPPSHDCG